MTDAELLALHRDLVARPSISGGEAALSAHLAGWLGARGVEVQRVGDNLFAECGAGPLICFNSHLDTVPAAPGWTRPPHEVEVVDGRVYGLGSNDAKASVAAMVAAFLRLRARGGAGARVLLTLAVGEEVGGKGTEALVPELKRRGLWPDAVVIGEPTGLDLAVAQKGLLILELHEQGRACHAAHRRTLGAPNALSLLARDLVALDAVDLGPEHPLLGPVTLEPTIASGGTAKNMNPAEARCVFDARTNPGEPTEALVGRLRAAVGGELKVLSDRLRPCAIDPGHRLVRAAHQARPEATAFGSRGLSDLVFFAGPPGIKVGPGVSERSHTPDEYVLEEEIIAGARFYEALVERFAVLEQEEGEAR